MDSLATTIRADYPEALWVQAKNLITAQINAGELEVGRRLPPERELCTQLNISRVTLRKALNALVDDGRLSASHGRGWFVAEGTAGRDWPNSLESFTETAERMGLVSSSQVIRAEQTAATLDEAEEFGIAPGAPLFTLVRVRMLSGVPTAVDHSSVPVARVPRFLEQDFTTASLYAVLSDAGIELARAEATIEAKQANEELAASLSVAVGAPILAMHQLVADKQDRPVLASTIEYSGERYRLRTAFTR